MMNRNRFSHYLAAPLARALVPVYRQHAGGKPSFSSVGCDSADPHWRVFTRQVFGLVSIAASVGAKISFVPLDSGVPRLAGKGRGAVLANHYQLCFPFRILVAGYILGLKPGWVEQGWLSNPIESFSILNTKTLLRAEPLSVHLARRNKHHLIADLAGFLLAHIFGHTRILPQFYGSGTTGQVAQALGRAFIGCELNPAYKDLQDSRTCQPSLLLEAA